MLKKIVLISLILLISSSKVSAYGNYNVEIFDVNKGHVVKSVENSLLIQQEVRTYLKSITNMYGKFKPTPKNGYMIKIFLEPAVMVQNQFMNSLVDEIIIVFPEQQRPFLLVFDDKRKLFFYNFEGETDTLLKILNYNQKFTPCIF